MFDVVTSWISVHGGTALDIALGALALQLGLSLRRVLESQVKLNESQDEILKAVVATQQNHEGRIIALETVTKPLGFQPRPVV
ncbi:MAG TPA: hypothetical protein VIY48_07645 [Candidatus Paceibacterota bacterium]